MSHEQLRSSISEWLEQQAVAIDTPHRNCDERKSIFPSTADCSSQILSPISEAQHQLSLTQLDGFVVDMDDFENSSIVSRSTGQTSFAARPTLVPTPPSTKRGTKGSRSPSPTRKLLALLEQANPPIRICQLGNAGDLPVEVIELRRALTKDKGMNIIPRALQHYLKIVDPDGFEYIPENMFDEDAHLMTNELEDMWQQVNSVYVEAERCQKHHKDENAWVTVICAMLRIAGMGGKDDMLELNSVQTQAIDNSLLPTLPENVLPLARKADLALAFSPYHAEVASKLNEIKRLRPGISLSQMSDAYTSTAILGCGMEVKESGGDYNEAVIQLGIWCSAGLEKMHILCACGSEKAMKPLIGITAIGHEWIVHISWKVQAGGETLLVGRWPLLVCSTASHLDIFVLRDSLVRIRDYLCNVFWPWYSNALLESLG